MSDMQAVKERIAMYKGAANHFVRRLSEYLESYFKMQVSLFNEFEKSPNGVIE